MISENSAPRLPTIVRLLVLLIVSVSGCANLDPKPDLARLYEGASRNQSQPPVIIIHGLMGSTLIDEKTREEIWPGSLSALAFSNYRELSRLAADERNGRKLIPGDLLFGIGGYDVYSGLRDTLEQIGRFQRGKPGVAVIEGHRRQYYILLYDWRQDNMNAVRALHDLIDQIRIDYADPTLRVDIVAHSNGGLIANYYLRYGPQDVLDWENPAQWQEASQRVRRVALVGTPSLGSVVSVRRLFQGFRIALRNVPVEVLTTFSTPFETLPHPLIKSIVGVDAQPIDMNIYDPQAWKQKQWSVYSPEVVNRVRRSAENEAQGRADVARLQIAFERNLHRAERFHWVMTPPLQDRGIDIAVFGGDCELTEARALLVNDEKGERLLFGRRAIQKLYPGFDHDHVLLEPGDGLVTRASQVGRATTAGGTERQPFNFFPIAQSFFLCERHGKLSVNPYFQDNLLYFLFAS